MARWRDRFEGRLLKAIQDGNADEEAVHRKDYREKHFEIVALKKEYERLEGKPI
ncbi:MAG: hypothetical protein ACXIUP_07565 [Microcella sp.]